MAAPRTGRLWPLVLAALVVAVVGSNLTLVVLSSTDPSFAVEPDYYDKALRWDDRRAQDARNAELGWTVRFAVDPIRRGGGATSTLTVQVVDRDGRPVGPRTVHVEAFHNARAGRRLVADLAPAPDGAIAGELSIARPGLWEFRFDVACDADRFTWIEQRDVGVR